MNQTQKKQCDNKIKLESWQSDSKGSDLLPSWLFSSTDTSDYNDDQNNKTDIVQCKCFLKVGQLLWSGV